MYSNSYQEARTVFNDTANIIITDFYPNDQQWRDNVDARSMEIYP